MPSHDEHIATERLVYERSTKQYLVYENPLTPKRKGYDVIREGQPRSVLSLYVLKGDMGDIIAEEIEVTVRRAS